MRWIGGFLAYMCFFNARRSDGRMDEGWALLGGEKIIARGMSRRLGEHSRSL
jgi:hypothetical protein